VVVRAAVARGLTHLAITDHERIDGALAARATALPELTVIVGEEIRTATGDLIGLYLSNPIEPGLSAVDTARLIREQGGVVGLPHPFDRFRSSTARKGGEDELAELLGLVDYVEVFNARVIGGSANRRAAEAAQQHSLPGVAVSDAHTVLEVGVSYSYADGTIESADELRAALARCELIMSRGSYMARATMPLAKLVQRWRGNPRQLAGAAAARPSESSR
jgi:predicted metal-dependent phosphoesterase TrpH